MIEFVKNKSVKNTTALWILILLPFMKLVAQSPNELTATQSIPLDPQVRYGRLPNGFTYYIRKNDSPANKVFMKLVVNAGTLRQDQDQVQVAHLLEHMGTNELDHFPEVGSLKNCLDKWGLKPGIDWNASTNSDFTDYYLILPADKPAILDTAWLIMRDWAQGIRLNQESVNAERGVVLGENRMRNKSPNRMEMQMIAKISNRPDHPLYPLDYYRQQASGALNSKYEALVRFYKDWYRPDLQAALIVGDINVDEVEKTIKAKFSDLRMPENPRPARDVNKDWIVHLSGKNNHIIVSDPEMTEIVMQVYWKHPSTDGDNVLRSRKDYKEEILIKIFNALMRRRIVNDIPQYNTPTSTIGIRYEHILMGVDALNANIWVNIPDEIKSTYQRVMNEIQRAIRYGFTEAELSKVKAEIWKTDGPLKVVDNGEFIENLVNYFLHGAAAPSPEIKLELEKSIITEITIKDLNEKVREWVRNENRDVTFKAPEKYKEKLPSTKTVRQWDAANKEMILEPYQVSSSTPNELLPVAEQPKLAGNVFIQSKDEETGVVKLKLVNGVRVLLKYIKTAPDSWPDYKTISISGFCKGGRSAYQDDELLMATHASEIISHAGVGKLNKFQLEQILQDKIFRFSPPSLSRDSRQVNVQVATEHVETALQLIYLCFVSPRKDPIAFDDWKRIKLKVLSNENEGISNEFEDMVTAARFGRPSTEQKLSVPMLDKIQLNRTYEIYSDNFSDPAGFTFVIAGDFDVDKVKTLAVQYLGNIASRNITATSDEDNRRLSNIYYGGSDDKAEVRLFIQDIYDGDYKNAIYIDLLGKALEIKILERIREKEGGSYSPHAGGGIQEGIYSFSVQFDCNVDKTEHLINAALDEVEKMRAGNLDATIFEKVMISKRQEMERALYSQAAWTNYMLQKYQEGKTVLTLDERKTLLETITLPDLKAAASKYFNQDNVQRFVWLPEKYKTVGN